jgi:glycosyltransferase involved in cell wall biosynthesis
VRVSIVICNYNYAPFLDGAIRSAGEQDYSDKEIIVVDDGSTDGSREIIARWDDAVRAVYKANGGQASAYNAGFERVTGDVVVFLDADDLLAPDACTRIVEAFASGVAKVHFRLRLIDANGRARGSTIPLQLTDGDVGARLRERGELYESAPGSGNAYRVSALKRLMPLPVTTEERYGADFFLIYATPLLGTVRTAGQGPLGFYRSHQRTSPAGFAFGNAPREQMEPARTYDRYHRLRAWVKDRLGESYTLPPLVPDFSLEKQTYSAAIFSAPTYVAGVVAGAPLLARRILPAIARRPDTWRARTVLTAWALGVLLLPRGLGLPIARYACNPAAR